MAADNNDKVFDVSKPGKTTASASGRPLIIGHKSMLKDPMMKEEVKLTDGSAPDQNAPTEPEDKPSGSPKLPEVVDETATKAPSSNKIQIKPVSEESETLPKSSKKVDEPSVNDSISDEAPAPDEEGSEEDKTDEVEAKDTIESDDSKSSSEAGEVAAVAAEAESEKKVEQESKQEAAQKIALEKLIEEKKYVVPIGQKQRKKRSLRNVLLGIVLILVLGALLADVLLDSGLVKSTIKPPIRIINR